MRNDPVNARRLKSFSMDIFRAAGVDSEQTETVAENLNWNDLVGRLNHGVLRLPIYVKRVRAGVLKCPCHPSFKRLTDNSEVLDGDAGFGQHVAQIGMRRAIELARTTGLGAVGVRNSNHLGTGAYFVNLAAEAGMLALATSNSVPKVAAFNGVQPVFGTNPIAFGSPRRNGRSLLVDMSTATSAGSTVGEYQRKGKPLPKGMAIDTHGKPMTDPRRILEGALLPFGGAKGFGLALMAEILCGVLTGAGISHGVKSMYENLEQSGDNGHFFVAIDISRWMPIETFFERLESLVTIIETSGKEGQVRLPGEIRWQHYDHNLVDGIPLEPKVRDQLETLARSLGVSVPW